VTSIVKVYVDNDIVSTLRRRDPSRPDYDAILELKRRSDRGAITVFVSDAHDRETTRLRADRQQAQQEVLAIFAKAVFRPQEDFIRHFPECSSARAKITRRRGNLSAGAPARITISSRWDGT
jgi:hypothetical protein